MLLALSIRLISCPLGGERSFACRRTIVHRQADDRSPGGGQLMNSRERVNG
ncbi:hypothetical protein H8784_01265 [Parabacteroides acidifaciens]|uniref:Uncharacterized protein n=1 Tax=Parabacteroides acidifaciens TaxID=2290935 RepID=A0ABR7NW62_9BACT|nr:hypothetical protein [Parabacteroides acidifaciens]MBC8600346.1 hypothetical protein [Parabacteroides acidifaciens]